MWRAKSLLWSWIANALALAVVVIVLHGVTIGGFFDLIEAALLFGILNTLVKPILKKLTLPLAVVTLRLIWFLIAAVILKLTAVIVSSFNIHGIFTLLWATLIVWLVNLALDVAPGPWRGTRRDRHALSRGK
jgi:putative membrane protein